jgi:hypothetical protein
MQGNYAYDRQVDLGNDFSLFLMSYLSGGGMLGDLAPFVQSDSALSSAQRATLLAMVPEPGCAGNALGALGLLSIRRRRV